MISEFPQKIKKMFKKSSILWDMHYRTKFFVGLLGALILKRKVVLSRSACLGQELFQEMYHDIFLVSQQKMRFDLFLDQLKVKNIVDTHLVRRYLINEDFLFPFLQEQKYQHWLKVKNIDFFMIDSFAELVDKKFTNKKEGWSFCCYGSDIGQTGDFDENFEAFGFLKIEDLDNTYRGFFDWFESVHKGKEVFFIHYPTTLDGRSLYKERALTILNIMKKIEEERCYVHNIYVDDSSVDWAEDDKNHIFPYHYSRKTMDEFIKKWEEINKKQILKYKQL